jgi:type IV secretion system protein VirB10
MADPLPDQPLARDPRPFPSGAAPVVDSGGALRPAVAGAGSGPNVWLVGGGAATMGLVAFLWLSSHRPHAPRDLGPGAEMVETAAPIAPAPPPPPDLAAMEAAGRGVRPAAPAPPPPAPTPLAPALPAGPAPAPTEAPPARSPVLVVDLAEPSSSEAATPATAPGAVAPTATASATGHPGEPATAAGGGLNGNEQFAERVSGAQPDRARATVLRNRSFVIAQGAMIPAVLETALDSDLPGFARAVVSRDVRSFDGATVLIPRGSRLIGEYRSATALGQSRAFVIWTRVLRADGVSIQIGSPVTDPLGRAGVGGHVDHHFLESFGGAILLSVITAGTTALAGGPPSTEVVIGSSAQASSLAQTASAYAPIIIPPTIKVPQGTPIRVFVARDLDFTPVQGAHE